MASSEDLLTPIPGDQPAGPNLRYEPVYDRIKDARRDDPLQDPPVKADWGLVEKLTREVLADRSKDLWIAVWRAEALLHRDGLPGLAQGLELVQGLLETFWDDVHPQPDDGDLELRAAPLAWLGAYLDVPVRLAPLNDRGHGYLGYRESLAVPTEAEAEQDAEKRDRRVAALEEGRLDPETFDAGFAATPKAWYRELVTALDAALERVAEIEGFGDERFGEDAPGFRKLREALGEVRQAAAALLDRKLELDPDPVAAESDTFGEDDASDPGAPVPGGPAQEGGGTVQSVDPTSREDAAKRIAAAARYLRGESPTDPAPFLLLRGFRWGELRAGGGAIEPRLLAAPPTELRTRLKGLLLDERWADLLEAAEGVMATPFGRGWLDLQRYALTAIDALGAEYVPVADAVRGALRGLLRELPELVDQTLMDDSPTANRETLAWLRAQGLAGAATAEDEEAAPAAPAAAPPVETVDRIYQRVGTSQPQRAIEILMRAADQEKSERARFLRRVDAARIMVESGLESVAMPMLKRMTEQIERHQLEEWENGQTVAGALGLLYRCMGRLGTDPGSREELYLRVARLDPIQAIHFREQEPAKGAVAEADGDPGE